MKSTGITKHVDKLGRFKIPKELRTVLNIQPQDSLYLSLHTKNKIIFHKIEDTCIFCQSRKNIHVFMGKSICQKCLGEIRKKQKF